MILRSPHTQTNTHAPAPPVLVTTPAKCVSVHTLDLELGVQLWLHGLVAIGDVHLIADLALM